MQAAVYALSLKGACQVAKGSWHDMMLYRHSRKSGSKFETLVMGVVQRHTNSVWRNIRVETLLAQTGTTELDVVFYYGGLLYVLELKRVRRIEGSSTSRRWRMFGASDNIDETSEYTALNVIEQNNIHARSLSDLYFSEFKGFPEIKPLIVVPDNCVFPPELQGEIYTVQELDDYLAHLLARGSKEESYRWSFLMNQREGLARRGDFTERLSGNGVTTRGRRRL